MQRFLDSLAGLFLGNDDDPGQLLPQFKEHAQKFYDDPESRWEPVDARKIFYVLRNDPYRLHALDRLTFLDRECTKLYNRLAADPKNFTTRRSELDKLRACLASGDGLCHIVQKPFGGYDVRAYAHDNWIFVELPTFSSIESGSDGINTTEERRRQSLLQIVLHEVAHVAGYWEHDDKHDKFIAWLNRYVLS